jgi:hypothetical protein
MKNYLFLRTMLALVFFVMSLSCVFAQFPPTIEWEKSYGGSQNDFGYYVLQTSDGGYIIVGSTSSNDSCVTFNHGGSDFWVIKTNAVGDTLWQKTYGGSNNEIAKSVAIIPDGYLVAGESYSIDGNVTGHHGTSSNCDYWVIKVSNSGNLVWQKSLGGFLNDTPRAIQSVASGCIVAGSTSSNDGDVTGNHGNNDYWVVKLDSAGNLEWQKAYGGISGDDCNSLDKTADGGFVLLGSTNSSSGDVTVNYGYADYWVVKCDSVGTLQWQKSFGGSDQDFGYSIEETSDGGFILAGTSNSSNGDVTGNHGNLDYWVVKLDLIGNLVWQKSLGGSSNETAVSVHETKTAFDGYLVAGESYSTDGNVTGHHGVSSNHDFWLVKLDSVGTLQWQTCLGGSQNDIAYNAFFSFDGGYVVAGSSQSSDGNVSVNYGNSDVWVIKLHFNLITGVEEQKVSGGLTVYPNPTSGLVYISGIELEAPEVQVFDLTGRILLFERETTLNLSGYPDGIYFLRITTNNGEIFTKKVVKK